jgi:hypothetical protein
MSQSTGIAINIRETSSVKAHTLGTIYEDRFGNLYRYTRAGAVALDPGKLVVNADSDTDGTNVTVARTYAAGVTEVIVDAAGAVAENAFADGTFTVSDATGEGFTCVVIGNTSTSGAGEMTVSLAQPTTVALTIDVSEATLQKSPWDAVLVSITDQADMPVGVPNVAIAADNYGWVQTRGTCAVLADEAVTKGQALTTGTGVAGAVEALDAAGEPQIGVAQMALVDTEYRPAYLCID